MKHLLPQLQFQHVVLVADIFEDSQHTQPLHLRRDLEMTDPETLKELIKAINFLGKKVFHYKSPNELAENAALHFDDVVLTIYGGQKSRNRMALVPAICETFNLKYIGPDVYGRIIAQDKEISKRMAVDCGLKTPAWSIVRDIHDIKLLDSIKFPVVVKPLYEGSSIGISQANLVYDQDGMKTIAAEILRKYKQPALIEQFVQGREVAFTKIQAPGENIWAFSEVYIKNRPGFFEKRLFDAHEKIHRTEGRTVRNIDPELLDVDRTSIDHYLHTVGNYGYCRVDGRFSEGQFWFLEFTPDAWIGSCGQFAMSFTEKGWTYPDVIAAILSSIS